MAQGGGRGWFHRKRPQPTSDEFAGGTTHSKSTPPLPAPASTEPQLGDAVGHGTEFAEWSPESRTAMAPESVRVQPGADSLLNGLSPRGPASGGQAPLGETPPAVAFTEAERPVSGSDSNSAQPSTERSPRPGFDWDAATAAALDADSNASAAVAEHHPAAPDRLLEDLIREIVGDATADTASALHPTRPTPERTIPASTASATGSAEAPLSIQADPSPSPAASPVATQPAESFAPHAPEQADLNAATSTPPAPIAG